MKNKTNLAITNRKFSIINQKLLYDKKKNSIALNSAINLFRTEMPNFLATFKFF